MKPEEKYDKILVRYFSNVLEEETVETLWVKTIDKENGIYKIDNIPFYGPEFSSNDIVFAEFDEFEEQLTFRNVVEYSGNSTIQIIVLNDNTDVEKLRDEFKTMNCESEGINKKYFVLDIPFETNYKPIFQRLLELESKSIIEFAEPQISEKHSNEK